MNPRGCQKGACYSDLMYAESRIVYPLKRAGKRGDGKWKRISWDDAYSEIAEQLVDVAVDQGTESIIFDHGTTNTGYGPETAGEMRFVEASGATAIDSWAGVGDLSMGAIQTWGMNNVEGTSDDWFLSDFIVIWCGNPSQTRIPDAHFLHEARYRGAKLVVIAPDLSPTTAHADMWLNVKPEADAALGMAAARVIIEENLLDADYVREQSDLPFLVRRDNGRFLRESDLEHGGADNALYFWDEKTDKLTLAPGCEGDGDEGRSLALDGLQPAISGTRQIELADGSSVEVVTVMDKLRERLDRDYTLEQARELTGLHPNVITRFAREMAAAPSAMIFQSWGSCKHYHSDLMQRAAMLLMALTGNQGKQGGGVRTASNWNMEGLDSFAIEPPFSKMEMLQLLPKAVRGLRARDYTSIFTHMSDKTTYVPLMPFLYVHAGYGEMWSRDDLQDTTLPRGIETYLKESIDRGWIKMHPAPDRTPKAFIFTGCNPLRRWPAPQIALKELWPKLDCVVSVNCKMSTSSMYADYFLPAAGYYEKYGIKYAQSYVPYVILCDKAVEPLGESKSEWEIFGRLSEAISNVAAQRGIEEVRGIHDAPTDIRDTYKRWSGDGKYNPYDPEDPVKMIGQLFENSSNVPTLTGRQALDMGAVPLTGPVAPSPIDNTFGDYDPEDTFWPQQNFTKDKWAWPTLTGRQQFYIDHEWYLEAGEELPAQKASPNAGSKYPLRMTGGHNRHSIHAIWRGHEMLSRLERGGPVIFMNPEEMAKRSINDGDDVRVYNHAGEFECSVKQMNGAAPDTIIMYHAWEPYQHKGWKGQQEPCEAPWKALHLAGGYGQLHYRMFYGGPSHAPKGTPVEVELVT
jgi:DMSO reductase family type II enzyme molybdopterin subunit